MSYVTLMDEEKKLLQYDEYWVRYVERKYAKTLARLGKWVEKDAERLLKQMGKERDFRIEIQPTIIVRKD